MVGSFKALFLKMRDGAFVFCEQPRFNIAVARTRNWYVFNQAPHSGRTGKMMNKG